MEKGISLIEVLLTIGIIVVLAITAMPMFNNLQASVKLNEAVAQTVQVLRITRERSQTGLGGARHGVYFETNQGATLDRYIIYRGNDYANRDSSYDRIAILDAGLRFGFLGFEFVNGDDVEINFSSGPGAPSQTGEIIITHNSGKNRRIAVNDAGLTAEK